MIFKSFTLFFEYLNSSAQAIITNYCYNWRLLVLKIFLQKINKILLKTEVISEWKLLIIKSYYKSIYVSSPIF